MFRVEDVHPIACWRTRSERSSFFCLFILERSTYTYILLFSSTLTCAMLVYPNLSAFFFSPFTLFSISHPTCENRYKSKSKHFSAYVVSTPKSHSVGFHFPLLKRSTVFRSVSITPMLFYSFSPKSGGTNQEPNCELGCQMKRKCILVWCKKKKKRSKER